MNTTGSWVIACMGALIVGGCVAGNSQISNPHAWSQCATITLVDNGDPTFGYGTAVVSEIDGFNQVGDDFSLTAPAHIQAVEFWGTGADADFTIRIFEVTAGAPGESPIYEADLGVVLGTPEDYSGSDYMYYGASLPEITLPAGDYLLSILDKNPAEGWYWAASCEDGCEGDSFRRANDGEAWDIGNWAFAFRLSGCEETRVCHCSLGQPDQCQTLTLGAAAVEAHLARHPNDTPGACE